MSQQESKLKKLFAKPIFMGATITAGLVFFIGGIVFWGGFNTAMEATNQMEFCIGCHEMENNVYQEYKPTIHYSNRSGVRATCPDCHVPKDWTHKIIRKIKASKEVWGKITGIVDTPEKFNAHRKDMAMREWQRMKETDSIECRNCHNFESMAPQFQKPRARKQHLNAFKTGQTCIDCHKGIAHKNVRDQLTDEELEEIEAPNPDFIREVPKMYLEGLRLITEQEAADKEKAVKDKAQAEFDEAERVAKAVEEALADYKAANSGGGASNAASTSSINVDWSKAASREITLFYPGETSIEWVLNGRDHGGARPFVKGGDRCIICHDQETADMGEKMVTGEKAESSPIPGKRGSIPVNVQATHDDEYLYMQFTWPDTKHNPVPFVEGGKMDPENPVKLAVMFATNDVEYADRAGCWGTCHHDAKNMPDAPEQAILDASALKEQIGLTAGVTKYIKESRTKIEVKGRRGKKKGGWDKLKDADALNAEMDAGRYMDIVRYKSGSNVVEDGHILADRNMTGGQGAEFDAKLKGAKWTVAMKRKLSSDKAGDVSLALDQVYNFGFAIHDDYTNSRFHHVSLGYKLGFDNAEAEVNAKKQ
ncbi:MAG: cytochrome C552 [Gammaproteobacteria bacterium]|nr:cytochrome C552 [Gammaproteobacteria bacterium]